MKKIFENDRVKTLRDITARHESREIEGCTSWRHFAVHQDRGWLLRAIGRIREQVEKIGEASREPAEKNRVEAQLRVLLDMFEEETLNHLGDEAE